MTSEQGSGGLNLEKIASKNPTLYFYPLKRKIAEGFEISQAYSLHKVVIFGIFAAAMGIFAYKGIQVTIKGIKDKVNEMRYKNADWDD